MGVPHVVKTQTELAKALGLSNGRVSQLKSKPWWPAKGAGGWDVEAIRETIARHRQQPSHKPAKRRARIEAGGILEVLRAEGSSPLEVSRAALAVASRTLAAAVEGGDLSSADLTALSKTLQELRQGEAAWQELESRRGGLLSRAEAAKCATAQGNWLVSALDGVGTLLATQVLEWLGDSEFRRENPAAQRQIVQDWWTNKTRAVRQDLTGELEGLLA